jgi:ATP-dependent Clp protease protease subunit
MIHQPWGGVEGQSSDIAIHAKEILRLKKLSIQYFAHHTGKSEEEIAQALERDFFMTADQAVEFGVADKVLNRTEN